jgi:hypothetical protein
MKCHFASDLNHHLCSLTLELAENSGAVITLLLATQYTVSTVFL